MATGRLQVHARERTDYLQVPQFLGSNIHQEIFSLGILAIEPLNGVLHRCCQFTVCPAERFEQHVSEAGIGRPDMDRIHQLLNAVIHGSHTLFPHLLFEMPLFNSAQQRCLDDSAVFRDKE